MGDTRCDGGGWQSNGSTYVTFDSVLLSGGTGYTQTQNGACCLPNGTCAVGTQAECLANNGVFKGVNTTCANQNCCPVPFADKDADGDVDQVDFGLFQECFGLTSPLPASCICFDRDNNSSITREDFNAFNACWSGPKIPANPSCGQ
jgi:hypothetical protein